MKFQTLLFVIAFACSAQSSRCDVIYNTFGPSQSFSNDGWVIMGSEASGGFVYSQSVAEQFRPNETANLSSIQIPLICFFGTNSFVINLAMDNSGLPGTIIETFILADVPSFQTIETLSSALHPLLVNNASYWLEVMPGDTTTSGAWMSRDPAPDNGSTYLAFDNGTGWNNSGFTVGPQAFEIDGAAVPEPATVVIVGLGTLYLVGTRCKFKFF